MAGKLLSFYYCVCYNKFNNPQFYSKVFVGKNIQEGNNKSGGLIMFDVKKYMSLARQVVAEGSVLLKNDRAALPLAKGC